MNRALFASEALAMGRRLEDLQERMKDDYEMSKLMRKSMRVRRVLLARAVQSTDATLAAGKATGSKTKCRGRRRQRPEVGAALGQRRRRCRCATSVYVVFLPVRKCGVMGGFLPGLPVLVPQVEFAPSKGHERSQQVSRLRMDASVFGDG